MLLPITESQGQTQDENESCKAKLFIHGDTSFMCSVCGVSGWRKEKHCQKRESQHQASAIPSPPQSNCVGVAKHRADVQQVPFQYVAARACCVRGGAQVRIAVLRDNDDLRFR